MFATQWGWAGFIAAVALVVACHQEEGPDACRELAKLKKETQVILREREQLHQERDEWVASAKQLESRLQQSEDEVSKLKAQRDRLSQELARISTDRSQLQQTIASLQTERDETKRNVEQLRKGLRQLLNQAETVSAHLNQNPPGVSQVFFDSEDIDLAPEPTQQLCSKPASCEDIPLNKKP
jgi:predicted RNase H-like nuclease (RuvC/YqgF family)